MPSNNFLDKERYALDYIQSHGIDSWSA